MRNFIESNIKGKNVLILFLITNIVYAAMLLVTIPKVMSFTGEMKLFDMLPMGYSLEYANSLLKILGETGRSAYLYNQIPLDMIYPLLFGITYAFIIAFFLKKLNKLDGSLFYVSLLPLAAGLFDYFENLGIISMLLNYPNEMDTLIMTTNVFTILKSALTTFTFITLIIVMVVLGVKKVLKKA